MAKTDELATIGPAREAIRQRLATDMLKTDDDAMERIGQDIMGAESVDDVLGGSGAIGAEDILDIPLTFRGFILRPAHDDYPDQDAFAVIDATDETTKQDHVITCGGFNVLNALIRLDQLGGFPVEHVMFRAAGRALRLYRAPHDTYEVDPVGENIG